MIGFWNFLSFVCFDKKRTKEKLNGGLRKGFFSNKIWEKKSFLIVDSFVTFVLLYLRFFLFLKRNNIFLMKVLLCYLSLEFRWNKNIILMEKMFLKTIEMKVKNESD